MRRIVFLPFDCQEEERFSNGLRLRPIGLQKRTSTAKAVHRQAIYGTAEAVPFVKGISTRDTHKW
jgi:hypothetical protein